MSKNVIEVNSAEFQSQVLQSDRPVVVDFWAEWCGPCRMMAPIFDAAAEQLKDKVRFVKVNVDENPDVAGRFMIQAIPTMVFVEGGKEKARFVGALSKERLLAAIEEKVGVAVA